MNVKIKASNIKCGGCVETIKKGLSSFKEINSVEVDIPTGTINLNCDDAFPLRNIKEKLAELGYPEINS